METGGTYQADTSADASTTPDKIIPLRPPWAQIETEMLTLGARCFSLGATRCLLYLMRYTIGFHTTTTKLTVDEFCKGKRRKDGTRFDEGTDLSRPSVLSGLHELERAHVVTITNEGHGRGTVATYELHTTDCWQVERLSIGKKSLPITDETSNGKESSPIAASNGKSSLPKSRSIGKKSLPHIKIDSKETPEKRNDLLSDASSDAPRPNATPSSEQSSSKPEKPAPKARKVYASDSDAYRLAVHLRDGILSHKPDARVPHAEPQLQQWAGVVDLMMRIDGRSPEQIRNLIDAIMKHPRLSFWRGVILSPGNLRKHFDAIEIKWRESGATRTQGNSNGRKTGKSGDWGDAYAMNADEMRQSWQEEMAKMGSYTTGKGKDA